MKVLTATNHSLIRYSARTGRHDNLALSLISSIRNSESLSRAEVLNKGFTLSKFNKNDQYYIWFDEKINDELLAIVSSDGFIKTVLRREMFSYINYKCKFRHEFSNRLLCS